jgi:mono/diheme cytochrome c family protein
MGQTWFRGNPGSTSVEAEEEAVAKTMKSALDHDEMSKREHLRSPSLIETMYRASIGVTLFLVLVTAVFVAAEHSLARPQWFRSKQATFVAGCIGTEFIPLPVLEILPDIDPDRFPPPEVDEKTQALAGGWIERYGFLERRNEDRTFPATDPELSDLLRNDREWWALPVGFTLSYYRPFSPDPSPVRFVGLACAGCHSARLPDRGPSGKLVYGAGNAALDLIGFFQALRGVLLKKRVRPSVPESRQRDVSVTEGPDLDPPDYEYALSLASVKEARRKHGLRSLTVPEQLMIWVWLRGAQGQAEKTTMKYDLPSTPEQLRQPEYNPNGPGRTGPFITLDNTVLNLPALHNHGYSKIPAVFHEKDRPWAQFDGSVSHPFTRSGLAAMTAGGSVDNLGGLGVGRNIMAAASYTVEELAGPRWADVFGPTTSAHPPPQTGAAKSDDVEAARLDEVQRRGRTVYRKYCASCHGQPDPAQPQRWLTDTKQFSEFGKIVPAINPFQFRRDEWLSSWVAFQSEAQWERQTTDPARVNFRDARIMPYTLFSYFDRSHPSKPTGEYYPLDHPLAIERPLIRNSGGYMNGPLDSLFVRAPYLHNASVPTLPQLINLEERPVKFLRGKNAYDPERAGLVAPEPGTNPPQSDNRLFWVFDTALPGNRNTGHNYPWAYNDKEKDKGALRDLLKYLKTL